MSTWRTTRLLNASAPASRVTRFNDNALEIAIALWRGLALLSMVGWFAAVVLAVVGVPGRWGYVAVALWLGGLLFGWLGFWQFGDSSWRPPPRGPVVRREEWADDDVNY